MAFIKEDFMLHSKTAKKLFFLKQVEEIDKDDRRTVFGKGTKKRDIFVVFGTSHQYRSHTVFNGAFVEIASCDTFFLKECAHLIGDPPNVNPSV